MTLSLCILILVFVALLLLETPIAFVVGVATVTAALAIGSPNSAAVVASDMANSVSSFALLAIPFFILAGELMGTGGLARRLIRFAAALIGRLPGGLAIVNTVTCMLFGAISGSAAAAISSIGNTLIPEMNRQGYPREFNVSVTTSGAITGLLIPPSNVMIVFAVVASVSVADLFLAGVLPGILMGLCVIGVCIFLSKKNGYGSEAAVEKAPPLIPSFFSALPSLLLVVLVLGGIFSGIFTATEASAVAVVWALVLFIVYSFFDEEVSLKQIWGILGRASRTTAMVLLLVATSSAMSKFLTTEQVPQMVSAALLSLSDNPLLILLAINVALLLVGTFMDITPAILIFTPILLPVALDLGLDPVHFGIIMITNLSIGLCTPPVGTCLFIGCGVGGAKIAPVSRQMVPFYAGLFVALLLITYLPKISIWLPNLINS